MMKTSRWLVPLALAAALVPAGLAAQDGEGAAPAELPPEAQELIAELQTIQAELEPIQQRAFQDPELVAEQQALAAAIQSAMVEADPTVEAQIERLQTLMAEAGAAQQSGDQARMGEVVTEARSIEQRLQAAQMAALQLPAIAPRVEQFQENVQETMIEVDPAAASLLDRARQIDARLSALLASGR